MYMVIVGEKDLSKESNSAPSMEKPGSSLSFKLLFFSEFPQRPFSWQKEEYKSLEVSPKTWGGVQFSIPSPKLIKLLKVIEKDKPFKSNFRI